MRKASYILMLLCASCNVAEMDKETKADITAKAKTDINFTGVRYAVEKGIVTLSGYCPSERSRQAVQEKVKKIAGVKTVRNKITIAPVTIGTDYELKKSVDSVLQQYPAITAEVSDSMIILSGIANNKQIEKVIYSLNELQPKSLTNHIVIY